MDVSFMSSKFQPLFTPTEANVLLHGLNELRNKWLEEGRDTYLVDEVFLHVIKKSEKKLRT